MSMRKWLIDNQINGDDGTGFGDYRESEGDSKLICHAKDCNNSTSETFFHCEQHGGEDGEGERV